MKDTRTLNPQCATMQTIQHAGRWVHVDSSDGGVLVLRLPGEYIPQVYTRMYANCMQMKKQL